MLENLLMSQALENTKAGTHMACACVDEDGTARIELLERLNVGWYNLTTDTHTTSLDMAHHYDDAVVTRLPTQPNDPSFCPPLAPGEDETCTHTPTCPAQPDGSQP